MTVLDHTLSAPRTVLCLLLTLTLMACEPLDIHIDTDQDDSADNDNVSQDDDQGTSDDNQNDDSDDTVLDPVTSNICEPSDGGRCLYAAPGASGNGSIDDPGHLHDLLPQLSGGDVLYLFQGAYTDYMSEDASAYILELDKYFHFTAPEPTADRRVRIQAYPTHEAIIQGDGERRCILVDGQSFVTFQDLIVEDCYNEGMRIGWDVPEEAITLSGMTFRDIEYNDNSGFVYIQGYHDVIIEDSTFHDYVPKANGQRGSYLKAYQATDLTIRNNHFYGDGGGLYYKHGESEPNKGGYTRIYGNVFEHLSLHGIYTNQNRTEIYDNLFVDTDGIKVHQEDGTRPPFTQDVDIHHNTLVDSAITLNRGSNDGSYMGAYGLGAKHATVRNNLLFDSDYRIWVYGSDTQYDEGIQLQSYDNCYVMTEGSMAFDYFSAENVGEKGGSYSLTQWQAMGYDTQSLETTLSLDANYQLPAGSACQFAGRRDTD